MSVDSASPSRMSRIPTALQAVFLASNRGKEVNKPPPERVAQKVFFRNWGFSRKGGSAKKLAAKEEEGFVPMGALSPQVYLDTMLYGCGYSNSRYKTLQSAYYNSPTEYQKASYGPHMLQVVKSGNVEGLEQCLRAGLSPNPSNAYGESLVHMACRRGNLGLLNTFSHFGANLQVADDYGRTPMHDACWAPKPAFDVVRHLWKADSRLFYMMDRRGSLPLEYVHRDHWESWRGFLYTLVKEEKDNFPPLDKPEGPPPLTKEAPQSRPLPNPTHALPITLASMVAAGKMSPVEATLMVKEQANADDTDDETMLESDDESDCSDYDSDDDSEDDEDLENLMGDLSMLMRQRR